MPRASILRSAATAVVVALLCVGCSSDAGPREEVDEGPVAGAGADVPPQDLEAWCGAITPAQLTVLTGFEVDEVLTNRLGFSACQASLPGAELAVLWGSEVTSTSFTQLRSGYRSPVGGYDPRTVTLDGGQRAVVAPIPGASHAAAATVADGRRFQVVVAGHAGDDLDAEELADVARSVLAVYFD